MVRSCGTRPAATGPAPGHGQAQRPIARPGCRHYLMRLEIRTVTPAEAAGLLRLNTSNRPLSRDHVAFFEAQLKRGEMQLTHQGIAVTADGILVDGQHRLTAIVNTGISAELLVAYDVKRETFSVLDTGATRGAKDVLAIDGHTNCSTLAGALRLYILYNLAPNSVWAGKFAKQLCTVTAIKSEYSKNAELWDWAAKLGRYCILRSVIVPGPFAAMAFIAVSNGNYSKEYVSEFGANVKSMVGIPFGHPILAFRNRVTLFRGNAHSQDRLADYIKLFNACATGQHLKQFKSQQYPPMPTLVHAFGSMLGETSV